MEKPAELSFCGLCLPWQLSTLPRRSPGTGRRRVSRAFSHAARRVFILHRANSCLPFHSRRMARFHLYPRHSRALLSSPEGRHKGLPHVKASPSFSGHGTFLSRRSCVAAKTEVPTQSVLLLPYEWLFIQLTGHRKRNPASGWTKSCSAGRNPHSVRSKSAGFACRRKSPQNFRSAGFVYPGSYLPCLGVAPARGEDGSRGTRRPTRRPTAVRAASQTAQRFAPALRG